MKTAKEIITEYLSKAQESTEYSDHYAKRIIELLEEGGFEVVIRASEDEWKKAVEKSVKMWNDEVKLRIHAEHEADRANNRAEYERARAVKAEFALLSKGISFSTPPITCTVPDCEGCEEERLNPPGSMETDPIELKKAVSMFCDAFDAGSIDINQARIIFGTILGKDNLRDPNNYLGILAPTSTDLDIRGV